MEFGIFHNDFFDATVGAYSRVTDREYFDSQITLTDYEADMVISHFGINNIYAGNVRGSKGLSSKQFVLYPEKKMVTLNLVFPKPHKTELRLYLSKRSSFKPLPNSIWFLFKDKFNNLVIGALDERIWNNIGQTDIIDEQYQESIEETLVNRPVDVDPKGRIITTNISGKTIFQRDPRIAVMRFEAVEYRCEINYLHQTFIAEKTRRPYMEAHHFIPIKFQPHFHEPLDNLTNIISLCPNCHRIIHHAVIDQKYTLIESIYKRRPELHNYSIEYLAGLYNSIKVPITQI